MQTVPETAIAPTAPHSTLTLDVGGMKCAGCVKAVENQLAQYPGVVSATVNLVTQAALIEYQSGLVEPQELAQKLTDAGFPSQPRWIPGEEWDDTLPENTFAEQQRQELKHQVWQVAIAATLLFFSAVGHLDHFGWGIPGLSNIWFHWGLATLALLGPGRSILVDGWRGLHHNRPNMNTLVGLGTLTSYTASVVALVFPNLGWECFFDEPVMLVGFILLGRMLEQRARGQATKALQSLLALQPSIARLVSDPNNLDLGQATVEIPAARVKVGEWLRVLPGERIPVDGEVVAGQTTVNEAMLTGESLPVLKQPGDGVAAGSLNQTGAIAIKTTRTGHETTLGQIIALVETAQTRKAPIQKLADTVAGYFTYGVMTLALVTFLFWYFIGSPLWGDSIAINGALALTTGMDSVGMHAHGMTHELHLTPSPLLLSLKLAIAVLVIACPCALGLATPTAILVGSGIGAERGLLIRGGDVLEKIHQLHTVVFDKTGTLTTGQPAITDCCSLQEEVPASALLQIAATVESGTQHPLATAIHRQAQAQELSLLPAQDFHTEPGFGVSAWVEGKPVLLGTPLWLDRHSIQISETAKRQANALAQAGKTLVYVAIDGQLAGLIAVQDTLRPDAQATVQQLQAQKLRVMLLTGDQPATAIAIAQSLGLASDNVLADVRPEGKAAAIRDLQSHGHRIAMVGDGINDAPALAQADVGIALHSGTDVAMETAGIVLMRDRLADVVEAIRLGRATFNKIQQNLFWALIYNTLGIPVAAGVLLPLFGIVLSPAIAGAFMAFSSVSVVTNSLLLRRTVSSTASMIDIPGLH